MKRLFIFLLLFYSFNLFSQEKYAVLLSATGLGNAEEKTISGNNSRLINDALLKQDFKPGNIINQSGPTDKETFLNVFDKLKGKLRSGDFVFLYIDLPTALDDGKSHELNFVLDDKAKQIISFSDLQEALTDIGKRADKDPRLFFIFLNSDLPAGASLKEQKRNPSAPTRQAMNFITSGSPGEKNVIENQTSLFAKALAASLNPENSFLKTYSHLHSNIERYVLMNSTKQHPMLVSSSPGDTIFNGMLKKYPVHFNILSRIDNNTRRINAGQNLNVTPGTRIQFYSAGQDTGTAPLAEGKVITSDLYTAVVRSGSSLANLPDGAWVYVRENDEVFDIPVSFNKNFITQNPAKKKIFETILANLRKSDGAKYLKFVDKGSELEIKNIETKKIENNEGEEITVYSITLANSLGWIYRTIEITDLNNLSQLNDLIQKHSRWQYLSRLVNDIPELHVTAELANKVGETEKENGFPIIYTNESYQLKVFNKNSTKVYYAIVDLQPDKIFRVLIPNGRKYPEECFILANGVATIGMIAVPPFGLEKFKVITSFEPIHMEGFDGGQIASRSSSITSFRPEKLNIQNLDYEIRNRAFATKASAKKIKVHTTLLKDSIVIDNPSDAGIYFNVLRQRSDGGFDLLFPNRKVSEVECYVQEQDGFRPDTVLKQYDQIITVYADRPFNLRNYAVNGRQLNDLVLEIHRNGRIEGSPLNKIAYNQKTYLTKADPSRGNELMIRLITPKISTDRGSELLAATKEFNINGFASTPDNRPVKSLEINDEPVKYDSAFRFFDATVFLAAGKNKIVIEAFDEKGFSTKKTIEIELKSNETVVAGKGKNYFLGIGIDQYKTWPQLNNAKNDILKFADLMENKFGFENADIVLLLDTGATRKRIINTIRTYLTKVKPNDNVIIYLSGHGNEDQLADGGYYFIPQDAEPDDVSSAVKSGDIIDNFKMLKAQHCVLIVDACYSGMITNNITPPPSKISASNENTPQAELPSKWIITSGRATKVSDGAAGTNSPFASVLLNYLRENNDESMLKMTKLIDYLKENVPKVSKTQMPMGVVIDGENEAVFSVKK